jgi:hypothetical protein
MDLVQFAANVPAPISCQRSGDRRAASKLEQE